MTLNHPVLALAWHSWRLSRRWYLIVLLMTFGLSLTLLHAIPEEIKRRIPENTSYQEMVAVPAFMLTFFLSGVAGLLAITTGNKNGFPFNYEFRMPVGTFTLTAVPMVVIGLLSASLHALPLGLYRLLYDIPFPIVPAVVMLCGNVFILLGASWCATGNNTRAVAITSGFAVITMLFAWIRPINTLHTSRSAASPDLFNPEIMALSGAEYLFMLLVMLTVLGLTVQAISARRGGETFGKRPANASAPGNLRRASRPGFKEGLLGAADALFARLALPCPVRASWAAELWVEFRRHGFPVLLLSLAASFSVPLLYLLGIVFGMPGAREMAGMTPLGLYFAGIGLCLLNRRMPHGGFMNTFERARPMGTARLALIQILATALAIALGMSLIKFSLQLSEPLTAGMSESRMPLGSLVAPLENATALATLCNQVMEWFIFIAVICLFSCVHSSSLFWGRGFLLGVLVLLGYCFTFIFRLQSNQTELQTIINQMWGFSALVVSLTLLVLYRVFRLGVLGWKGLLVMCTLWLLHLLCSMVALQAHGFDFARMAPELLALSAALLLLPLTFAAMTLWCYDKLRHG